MRRHISPPRSAAEAWLPPVREFIFSPEVGRSIDGPGAGRSVSPEDVEAVGRYGRGSLTIEKFDGGLDALGCPFVKSIEFTVRLDIAQGR